MSIVDYKNQTYQPEDPSAWDPVPDNVDSALDQLGALAGQLNPTTQVPGFSLMLFKTGTGQVVDIYVDATNGNDAWDGTSATHGSGTVGPLKTIAAVWTKYPMFSWGYNLIIHLAAGTYLERVLWMGGLQSNWGHSVSYRGPAMIAATLASGTTTPTLDAVPATEISLDIGDGVTTPLQTRFNFTGAPGWTVDDMVGRYFVRITRAGVKRYFELPISENDASTITVDCVSIVGDLLATDTFEIVMPAVTIKGNPTNNVQESVTLTGNGSMVSSLSPNAANTTGGSCAERINFPGYLLSRSAGTRFFDRCSFFKLSITGGGLGFVNCACRGTALTGDNNQALCAGNPFGSPSSRRDSTTDPTKFTGADPNVSITNVFTNWFFGARTSPEGSGESTFASAGVFGSRFPFSVHRAPEVAGHASVVVAGPGSLFFMGPGGVTNTIVTPVIIKTLTAAGIGIWCRMGAQAKINPAKTSITGTTAHLKIDQATPISLGTLPGEFSEVIGYNGNYVLVGAATRVLSTYY